MCILTTLRQDSKRIFSNIPKTLHLGDCFLIVDPWWHEANKDLHFRWNLHSDHRVSESRSRGHIRCEAFLQLREHWTCPIYLRHPDHQDSYFTPLNPSFTWNWIKECKQRYSQKKSPMIQKIVVASLITSVLVTKCCRDHRTECRQTYQIQNILSQGQGKLKGKFPWKTEHRIIVFHATA